MKTLGVFKPSQVLARSTPARWSLHCLILLNSNQGRDLSALIGLTPKHDFTGGKERRGRILKVGNRYLRCPLYLGTMAQVSAHQRGELGDDWLWRVKQHKKPKQVAIILANRMARTTYARMKNQPEFPAAIAA